MGPTASDVWNRTRNFFSVKTDYTRPPIGLKWRSNTFFIVATVAVGLFTDLFLYGLVVPVLPFMLTDKIGVPEDQVQRYVSALLAIFAGTSVVASPIAGFAADKMPSRRGPFLFGLIILLLATFLLFFGTTVPMLVIARGLQGMSGAFVWTIGLALCLETVGPDNLGKTIGSIFSVVSVGGFVAPIVGGVLYAKAGLVGVFGIGCAVILVDLIMRLLVIEKKSAKKYQVAEAHDEQRPEGSRAGPSQDPTAAEQQPGDDGEAQPLLGNKKKIDERYILPENLSKLSRTITILPCLADPRLLIALLTVLVQALLFGAFDSTIPIVAQEYFGFDSLKAGILFAPLSAFELFLGPVFGWCVDKFGAKPVAVLGYAYLIPVLILLRISHPGDTDQIIIYAALLALSGIGISSVGAPSFVDAGAVVQKYHEANPDFFGENGPYAQLYGLSNVFFGLGLTVGPEIAGELKDVIGYGNMNAVLAAICAVTSLLSFVYVGGVPQFLQRKPA